MDKYLINGIETDAEEFNAEFIAQLRAFVDENFDELLRDYSGNTYDYISVGYMDYDIMDIFDMLSFEKQRDIEQYLYEEVLENYGDQLDYHGSVSFTVQGEKFEFTIEYVDEE